MDVRGREYRYGEFFPPELNPFAYNETIAQEYFSLNKEKAISQGYHWRDQEDRNYEITKPPETLPDDIQEVNDLILNDVVGCEHKGNCNEQCTTAFKVILPEFQFHKKMNISLSRLCPNCRYHQRLKQRNPLKLWHRRCTCTGVKSSNGVYQNTVSHFHGKDRCPKEFQTSYNSDRPEIVYCEQCYQQEIA